MGQMHIACDYCGKVKEKGDGYDFVIGASLKPDWVMVEGTGKMCCPDCWEISRRHADRVIKRVTGL